MKKQYMTPTAEVIKIESHQIIAASPGLGGDYNGGSILGREMEGIEGMPSMLPPELEEFPFNLGM